MPIFDRMKHKLSLKPKIEIPSCLHKIKTITGALNVLKNSEVKGEPFYSLQAIHKMFYDPSDCSPLTEEEMNKIIEESHENNPCALQKLKEFLTKFSSGKRKEKVVSVDQPTLIYKFVNGTTKCIVEPVSNKLEDKRKEGIIFIDRIISGSWRNYEKNNRESRKE